MTDITEINAAVDTLAQLEMTDFEAAHALEDRLLWRVTQWICEGEMARAIMLAEVLCDYRKAHPNRSRYCA